MSEHPETTARLDAALTAALAGRPRVVVLAGSPEDTAPRVAEIAARASERGAATHLAECSPGDASSRYAVLGRLARAVLGGSDLGGSDLGDPPGSGYLEHLLGLPVSVADLAGMDGARLRQGAFLALGDLLVDAAQERPLFLAVSGLQWAGPATREWIGRFVHRLAAEERSVRLLLLVAGTRGLDGVPSRPGGDLAVVTLDLEPPSDTTSAGTVSSEGENGPGGSGKPAGSPPDEADEVPEPPPSAALQAAHARMAEALAFQQRGDHREAISGARRALVAFEALGRPVDAATAHGLAGNCYQRLGEWELAQLEHEAALEIRERIGDVPGLATSLNNLAILSASLGRWQGAHQYYLRSLALARRMGEFRSVAIVLGNLGELLLARGDDGEAERRLLEGLEIAARTGDRGAEIVIVGNLAAVYLARNAPAQALEALDRCLALISETDQVFYAPEVHYCRGRALQLLGNVAAAREEHEAARALAESQGHLAFLGIVDRALAELLEGSGRKPEAFELALRSEEALRPAGMPLEHARTLAVLARLAPPGKREEWAQAALAYFERLGARREAARMRDVVPVQSRLPRGTDDLRRPPVPRK